jgi:hypothetical protein
VSAALRTYTGLEVRDVTRDEALAEQIGLIRDAAERYNRGGVPAVERYFDDAVELSDAGLFFPAATYHGKADVVKYFQRVDAAFEDVELTPLEFIERPPAVVVPFRLTAQAGKLQMIVNVAFWVHTGKIRRMQSFRSREAALRHPYAASPIVG